MPSVQNLAAKAATTTRDSFLAGLGGRGVLVRLDERGGRDEPAPWAFHGQPQTISLPPRDDEGFDADSMRRALDETQKVDLNALSSGVFRSASADDETLTSMQPPPSLPVPAARGAATVHVVPDAPGGVKLGRARTNEIAIDEMSLSRTHAIITVEDGQLFVRDNGSRNGTRVNGGRLEGETRRKLRSGDVVSFGDVDCLYLTAGDLFDHLPRLGD